MPYGDIADRGMFRETFEARAFGPAEKLDTTLNVMHVESRLVARTGGGGLIFRDTAEGLQASAELPATTEGDDTLTLINRGVLRGFSVEFRAIQDRFEGSLRRIARAALLGLGIVDRPAYQGAEGLQVRRALEFRVRGRTLTGLIPTGRRLGCKCQGPTCNAVEFADDAFEVAEGVLAVNGSYGAPIGSARRGDVRFTKTPAGLAVEIDIPDNEIGTGLIEIAEAVPVFVRPFLDPDASSYQQTGDLRTFTRARVRAFIIGTTDADEGIPEAKIRTPTRQTRRALWPSV